MADSSEPAFLFLYRKGAVAPVDYLSTFATAPFLGCALCGGKASIFGAARRSGAGVETRREASTSENSQFLRKFIGQGTAVFRAVDGLPEVGSVEVLIQKIQRGAGELFPGIGGFGDQRDGGLLLDGG